MFTKIKILASLNPIIFKPNNFLFGLPLTHFQFSSKKDKNSNKDNNSNRDNKNKNKKYVEKHEDNKNQENPDINEYYDQVDNLEVVSQSNISSSVIIQQIKKQRLELEGNGGDLKSVAYQENLWSAISSTIRKSLIGITGLNIVSVLLLSAPIIANNFYWLGVLSSGLIYPSLIFVTCANVGINIAYLIVRQGLSMNTPISSLNKISITNSPLSLYFQIAMIGLQMMSLAAAVSIPLTVMQFGHNIGIYSLLTCLLATNAHSTYQQKQILNLKYQIRVQSWCFAAMFFLSAFIFIRYSNNPEDSKIELKNKNQFREGWKYWKEVWKIKRVIVQDENITNILTNQSKPINIQ